VRPGTRLGDAAAALTAAARDAELGELRCDDRAVRRRIDSLVDVEDAPVQSDVERPTRRERLVLIDDAVRRRHGLRWIAQQRIVDAKGLRERSIGFGRVDADGEMRDVEAADRLATLTE